MCVVVYHKVTVLTSHLSTLISTQSTSDYESLCIKIVTQSLNA